MISYESAHDCWRPKYIEIDHFVHEDVDLVVIFGRMGDAKLGLKLKCLLDKFKEMLLIFNSPSVILVEAS